MARLFISYSRRAIGGERPPQGGVGPDQEVAYALRQWLVDQRGWPAEDIFVDVDHLHAGEAWEAEIRREAEACEAMLFLASERSLAPDSFCRRELQWARRLVIGVTLDGLDPGDPRGAQALALARDLPGSDRLRRLYAGADLPPRAERVAEVEARIAALQQRFAEAPAGDD